MKALAAEDAEECSSHRGEINCSHPHPSLLRHVDQDDNGLDFCPGMFPREEPRSGDKVQDARGRKPAKASVGADGGERREVRGRRQ